VTAGSSFVRPPPCEYPPFVRVALQSTPPAVGADGFVQGAEGVPEYERPATTAGDPAPVQSGSMELRGPARPCPWRFHCGTRAWGRGGQGGGSVRGSPTPNAAGGGAGVESRGHTTQVCRAC
jgi:hypothetical protein